MKYLYRALAMLLLCGLLFTLPGTAYAESALQLPGSLKIIEENAFYGDRSLGKVVLPDGITEIRSKAFADSSVSNVNLPVSLDCIADDAFDGCSSVSFTAAADSYGFNWAKAHGFKVTDPNAPKYRALLIGNNAYMVDPLQGCINDMKAMSNLLRSFSNGFACTTKQNQTKSGMLSAIRSVFAGAAEKDVSLFYYAGHGAYSSGTTYLGALCGVDDTYLTSKELAAALSKVPGRVIVVLDSCYSGAVINRGTGYDLSDLETFNQDIEDELQEMDAFNQSMIDAFAGCDTTVVLSDDAVFDSGELAKSKFVVITACGKNQSSGEINKKGLFTTAFVTGGGCKYGSSTYTGSMPADTNKDKKLTVNEIASYARSEVKKKDSSQTVQYYASNTSEVLFWR